ncbi:hypothetical protein VOLCADRAFT_94799 [Volvox carteri f. nagariensis]|uniref:Uncharacterized protein n=1 Tax=Volvox carteri f. nagariensis TaxID=3068 RepID=D8U5T0_VOLCA|nr:uncharacterized protein VOLCADRAFT_94799 [Volvox carteri f. nagariensis]EFJ44974.1 hypothetical protein VOLCADRAFT_94799 [Volvox carteri f. nagariensis]|eukprot:XP_002953945.1 hypothetical protein VOLCADRAFT_94799 [Volvox carteri f. nagariensis]
MAHFHNSSTGGGDYDYPDDFTDISDDQDLPLPEQSESAINGGNVDDGEFPFRVGVRGTRPSAAAAAGAPAAIDSHQRDPWIMQLGTGDSGPSSPIASGLTQARFTGSASIGAGMAPLRNTSITSGRSLFGPFGCSSLQHRDSLGTTQPHPLAHSGQHYQHVLPQQAPRPPQSPVQQRTQTLTSEQQQRPRDQGRDRPSRTDATLSEVDEASGEGDEVGAERGGADRDPWSYLDADPFVLAASSSCSSSLSASRDPSPQPHPAASTQPFPMPFGSRVNGPRPWYEEPQYERHLGLGLGLGFESGLGQRSSGSYGARGLIDEEEDEEAQEQEGQPRGLGRELGSFGVELGGGEGPAADTPHGSGGSSDSSHSSWAGQPGLDPEYDGAGPSGSQPATTITVLWPLGGSRDVLHGVSGSRLPAGMAAGETNWALGSSGGELRHRHANRARASEQSDGWRPPQDGAGTEELQASIGGTSSSALRRAEEPSWEHQYGGGLGARSSLGLSYGGNSSPTHRYGQRSTLADSNLSSGLGPSQPALASAGFRGATPSGLRVYHPNGYSNAGEHGAGGGGGLGGGNGLGSAGGTTLCFTSIDSPSGPYDRRHVVLRSAQRRNTEASTPSVRQYSDGLAGMLTNAQIQEWMSQHASRLLLPRHMQEIADIVFRPPSAVPEKKPLKHQPSGVTTLPPPVVLGGRYPPLHVSRLANDAAFISGLLACLSGVDPANSRVQAVITALQGKDVVVMEEAEGGEGETAGRFTLTKSLRPPSRIQPK